MADETRAIIEEFRRICAIPHGSGQEQRIGAYLKTRLEELGLRPRQDAAGNLLAEVPARGGGGPVLILQAHMDMVVAGEVPAERASVRLTEDGGVLRSDGRTSLGADNGVGAAVILYLLGREDFVHGPLRVLFTVGEELGLQGARQVPPEWLLGAAYLINTDGFHADTELVGCKSGLRELLTRSAELRRTPPDMASYRVALTGFLGGHSGDDIHRGRCNTIQILAAILRSLQEKPGQLRVCGLTGGAGFNVIPAQCQAEVAVARAAEDAFLQAAREIGQVLLAEYRDTDGGGALTLEPIPTPRMCWKPDFQQGALELLAGLVNGVCGRDGDTGAVVSSCNLGQAFTEDGVLRVHDMLRCDTPEQEARISAQHRKMAEENGFSRSVTGYHSWHGDRDSRLAQTVASIYREQNGRPMQRRMAQVGVETAYFHEKAPALQMVCLGAEIQNAHSVQESVRTDSAAALADLIFEAAAALSEEND